VKVLYLAAEATPFVKVGGLADVAGELPRVLTGLGVDARLCLPFYPLIREAGYQARHVFDLTIPHQSGEKPVSLYQLDWQGMPVYLIDAEAVRSDASVYGDILLEGEKFTLASLTALKACQALDWKPDIVHANDWHTAMSIVWLIGHRDEDPFWQDVIGLFSIHNLAYMGAGIEGVLDEYGLPASSDPRLPDWARHTPLPMALAQADWISTVSPTYAQEIQTAEFGYGLESILQVRQNRLVGILNGIDPQIWDPSHDDALPVGFSVDRIEPRVRLKETLQEELDFVEDETMPLIAMVTRLDRQKGIDLAFEALEAVQDEDWQFVLLGTGSDKLERRAQAFADDYEKRVRVILRFDSALARRIYAGADMLLVPSRYEPCGLAQLIAMRYGCVPVVRETGGLKDTVMPYNHRRGTGFLFKEAEAQALASGIRQALAVYRSPHDWKALQLRCMRQDHSWENTTNQYLRLYEQMLAKGQYEA